jgi:hypothetical protein
MTGRGAMTGRVAVTGRVAMAGCGGIGVRAVIGLPLALLAALALLAVTGVAGAFANAPHWDVITRSAPTYLEPGEKGEIVTVLVNLGDAPVIATPAEPVTIADTLPAGVEATREMSGTADTGVEGQKRPALSCKELRCAYAGEVPPFVSLELSVGVRATKTGYLGENEVKVEGGNAPPRAVTRPLTASAGGTPFGVERYELSPEEEDGSPASQAGSHPFQLTTTIEMNQTFGRDPLHPENELPATPALLKNLNTTLPPGLLGDPTAIPKCSDVAFSTLRNGDSDTCPANTAVGAVVVTFKEPFFETRTETFPVFNLTPAYGEPARFGFEFDEVPVILDTSVRTGAGYAVEVKVANVSQAAELLGSVLTIWGVPGDARHDDARGWECLGGGHFVEHLEPRPACNPLGQSNPPPYLTLPTSCKQPLATSVQVQSWQPGASLLAAVEPPVSQSLEGCNRLPFEPSIAVRPDQGTASTPSGLKVEMALPQATTLAANGLAEADLQETTVTLPEGMQANPGAADGLETCSAAGREGVLGREAAGFDGFEQGFGEADQLENDHFTPGPVTCPDASKIGEVAIDSPLLENELKGFVYMGEQDTDPFTSPLVMYVVAEDPVSGVRVKLAGEVQIAPNGRLISVFKNTPPLPFETLKLHLFDGPRATLATPAYCRSYETVATFVPWWGGQAAQRSSSFTPGSGPNGGPCQTQGPLRFEPAFQTGSADTKAGAFTTFELNIDRPDGDQALSGVTVQLPPGLAALIAKITPCPEPPAGREWACGPDSLIGKATTGSGLGPDPVTLNGNVYLTSGYDGAPYGLLVSTRAHAGPFELGVVDVRSRIEVNRETAAVSVTTDPGPRNEILPTILKGVPVQLKQLYVAIDRPEFMFNPTNCDLMSVGGRLTGDEGAIAEPSSSFGVVNCSALPFEPKLTASVVGHGSKAGGTTFSVTVQSPGLGQANIRKVDLTIPKLLSSRLTTLQKACPEAVFNGNPAGCGEGSVIGRGTVSTPVFKEPLTGRAYLVSHGGAAFPDIEFVLKGDGIEILLDGKTQIKNGITYSRFEALPDAPFTRFESIFPAGPHSVLTPNVPEKEHFSLCKQTLTMPTEISGQDGAFSSVATKVSILGCGAQALTRAQLLAKAIKVCRARHRHSKRKRAVCERRARRRYAVSMGARSGKKLAGSKRF